MKDKDSKMLEEAYGKVNILRESIRIRGGSHLNTAGQYGEKIFNSHEEARAYIQKKYPQGLYGRGVKWDEYTDNSGKTIYTWEDKYGTTIFEYQVIDETI